MIKKVYADYHGPRFTREHDGEFAQWQYSGIARKSKVEKRSCNYNPDRVLDNGLNDIATMSYPLIGMQSQHDEDYIEYQILLAKIARIDGFFVEWGFKEHKSNEELKTMMNIAEKYEFEIGINWCDAWHFYNWIEEFYPEATSREKKVELFKKNIQYLIDEVFSKTYAAKFNGHPIILLFGGGPTLEEFEDILNSRYHTTPETRMPYFFTRANINGIVDKEEKVNYKLEENSWLEITDGVFGWIPTRVRNGLETQEYNKWDRYATTNDCLGYLETLYKIFDNYDCKIRISSVNPEMDNRACASWDKHDLSYIPRNKGKTYESMWKYNVEHKDKSDIAYIVSWNDYTERHQIEPTITDGYREILTTQKYASAYKEVDYSVVALAIPMELFKLRKKVKYLAAVGFQVEKYRQVLDEIALQIAKANYSHAELHLRGLEQIIEHLNTQIIKERVILTPKVNYIDDTQIELYVVDKHFITDDNKYITGYITFDYVDNSNEFLVLKSSNQQDICNIKLNQIEEKLSARIELFNQQIDIDENNKWIFKGNCKITNVKIHLIIHTKI